MAGDVRSCDRARTWFFNVATLELTHLRGLVKHSLSQPQSAQCGGRDTEETQIERISFTHRAP